MKENLILLIFLAWFALWGTAMAFWVRGYLRNRKIRKALRRLREAQEQPTPWGL